MNNKVTHYWIEAIEVSTDEQTDLLLADFAYDQEVTSKQVERIVLSENRLWILTEHRCGGRIIHTKRIYQ